MITGIVFIESRRQPIVYYKKSFMIRYSNEWSQMYEVSDRLIIKV